MQFCAWCMLTATLVFPRTAFLSSCQASRLSRRSTLRECVEPWTREFRILLRYTWLPPAAWEAICSRAGSPSSFRSGTRLFPALRRELGANYRFHALFLPFDASGATLLVCSLQNECGRLAHKRAGN